MENWRFCWEKIGWKKAPKKIEKWRENGEEGIVPLLKGDTPQFAYSRREMKVEGILDIEEYFWI